jgi:hypothetical protein
MDPDTRIDLQHQLEANYTKIIGQYASYVHFILTSLKTKEVSVGDLCAYLLSLSAFQTGCCNQKCELLSSVKPELEKATTVYKIFESISKCTSFFNYQIYQYLINQYDIEDTRDRLKYPDYLNAYIKKHKISEFIEVNQALKEIDDVKSTKLVLKFDIELTCEVAKVAELRSAIAKLLHLNVAALQLVNIDDGCMEITFLISTAVADILFNCSAKMT